MAAGNGGPRLDSTRRKELADSFQDGADHYERVRPGYPPESLDWLLAGTGLNTVLNTELLTPDPNADDSMLDVLDLGAGTGKYTALLLARGLNVIALDPSRDMLMQLQRRYPAVRTMVGTAERIDLPDSCMHVVTAAQAWHWVDPLAASAEISRVLRPGGVLGLVWNQLDVSVPWVHRLSRIMHAGDVHKPGFRPLLGPEFGLPNVSVSQWIQPLTPLDLMELAKSRSYYLRANEDTRAKVLANLRWYLLDHLGHAPDALLELPYLTQTWRAGPRR
ncbi:class I SAM-dependent methyltransferase [Paeniglutamicibacter antarcticus]|uniref:Class I SAM-dependent methyltransferase n=1 Tax=Arthrobacter terrae TaxID=2935737 RepID=A0A931CS19_9MICC|nr:class I SAM-dependent methyltransferase [Arthrobacter terrae]MBG0741555.1 class I SAM-dependent methyltransferase [Arthrobacter terrae]